MRYCHDMLKTAADQTFLVTFTNGTTEEYDVFEGSTLTLERARDIADEDLCFERVDEDTYERVLTIKSIRAID